MKQFLNSILLHNNSQLDKYGFWLSNAARIKNRGKLLTYSINTQQGRQRHPIPVAIQTYFDLNIKQRVNDDDVSRRTREDTTTSCIQFIRRRGGKINVSSAFLMEFSHHHH